VQQYRRGRYVSNKQGNTSGGVSTSAQGSIQSVGEVQSRNNAQRDHMINSKSERAPVLNEPDDRAMVISEREKLK